MITLFFKSIKKSEHYIKEHEREVPWSEVVTVILKSAKNMKKKGNKIEIKNKGYYILCEIKNNDIYVINAKRKM